jgi:hypothetical protein
MNSRLVCPILLACLACKLAYGAQINGPDEVESKSPKWYSIEGLSATESVAWFPSEVLQAGPPHIQENSALFWSANPGPYTINAIVIDWDQRSLYPLTKTVRVVGGGPVPPDPPNPDPPNPDPPKPDPPPKGQRSIVVIEESSQRSREFANLLQDLHQLQEYCRTNKHRYTMADRHDPNPTIQAFARHAQQVNVLPCLFIGPYQGGEALYVGPVPTDVDKLIRLIQKYGG